MKILVLEYLYQKLLKPFLFLLDPELVHNLFTEFGFLISNNFISRYLLKVVYGGEYKTIIINGVTFKNKIGLSAGFDYNGKMVGIMQSVGFGYNTVGTVTYKEYQGNTKPRLARLPKSQSLLVNKGFKSDGVKKILPRLNKKYLKNNTFGVSVGSSNLPEINTIDKAIDDYIETFKLLENSPYIKYYELNISCPNTTLTENFTNTKNFEKLLKKVVALKLKRPVFIKMPNELEIEKMDLLVDTAFNYNFNSFIFSNLVKNRQNKYFESSEIKNVENLKGNFSGKPCFEGASNLVKYYRQKYKDKIVIIGCGGVMSREDAKQMLNNGADLIQLITGMIYKGPQLISELSSL